MGEISDEEFSRAKNRLIAIQLMNRESRQILCEDLGRQVYRIPSKGMNRSRCITLITQVNILLIQSTN